MREEVHLPGQTVRRLEDRLDGGDVKERQLRARQTKQVLQVERQLFAAKASEMMTDDDARIQRFMDRHPDAPPQLCLSHQQQAETVLRVHLVVGA